MLKELKDFPKYFISDEGIIYSKRSGQLKEMKTYITNGTGYKGVTISIKGKRYKKSIHRLVAETFLENPSNYSDVDHIDNNRLNNNVNNLRWCSRSSNIKKAYDSGRMPQAFGGIKHVAYVDGEEYARDSLLKLCEKLSKELNAPYHSLVKFKEWKNIIISKV